MSVGYFLAFVLRNSRELRVNLSQCSIDDHSFGLMMGELSKHAEACPAGALHGVTELNISYNEIGDNGIAHIATALQRNNTLKTLFIGGETTTDEGALSLAAALTANSSMEYLRLIWSSTHPDSALKNIGECVSKSTLRELELEMNMPSGEAPVAEERAKEYSVWRFERFTH